jgi:hypothetical protein
MLDEGERAALSERLENQAWDQGSLIDWRADVFLASPHEALTPEAEKITTAKGHLALVFEVKGKGEQMIVVSQRCDIVGFAEPLVEAIPLQKWPADRDLPGLNSSRYFVIDRTKRLVADATRRLSFEKTLLPNQDARQLCANESEQRSFAAWCARRYSRVAFPDDLVATVGFAIEDALRKNGKKQPVAREALHSWRVLLTEPVPGGPIEVSFLVAFDEEHEGADAVKDFVASVLADARTALPKFHKKAVKRAAPSVVREHQIAAAAPVGMNQISLRDLRLYPAFTLEHMTYDGQDLGVEPHEEALA